MTANHSSRASGQESTDTEIIECGDDAEILGEGGEEVRTDGGQPREHARADGGTRPRTPVDDLASPDDATARLEDLDPIFAKGGFSIEGGPVVVNSAPHGADVDPAARPDPVVIEAFDDGEIFAGVQFEDGQMTGDGGFVLDEDDALQLARALVLAVDADRPVSWGL